jgi:hypothetical protein
MPDWSMTHRGAALDPLVVFPSGQGSLPPAAAARLLLLS